MFQTIKLPFEVRCPILACGADLKGAFALALGDKAYLSEGFGDLSDPDNLERYAKAIKNAEKRLGITPKIVACDLHPEYFSTQFAENYGPSTMDHGLFKIQHHEAHVASAIIDNAIKGDCIGVAFDGTGLGSDGNIWGGEFFIGNLKTLKRVAHFDYIPMPGGEIAIRELWRMALSYLYRAGVKPDKRDLAVVRMIKKNINSPLTSSAGRLFDAVGSLILGKRGVVKEAEIPIELEKIALPLYLESYGFEIKPKGEVFIIDMSETIRGVVKDLAKRNDKALMSSKFHNTMAEVILKTSAKLRKRFGVKKVVLTGGVFQNKFLSTRATERLKANDFDVYSHLNINTNDSGIPIGQIAVANEQNAVRCTPYAIRRTGYAKKRRTCV